jgi:tetratricopeptide (TPR) repeat protein
VGANESTKIRFSCPVWIGEHPVPAGTYALYAFPEPDRWEIVVHKDTTHWGDGRSAYDPQEDLFRWATAPEQILEAQENFQIQFDSITHAGMQMLWTWDSTRIRIPLRVDTHSAMEKEIAKAITERPTAQTYYEAARYLQEADREFPRALTYVNLALQIGGDTYYHYRVKSLILAGMKDYREAIACARRSQELAAVEGKDEFVRMNQRNIAKWTGLLR